MSDAIQTLIREMRLSCEEALCQKRDLRLVSTEIAAIALALGEVETRLAVSDLTKARFLDEARRKTAEIEALNAEITELRRQLAVRDAGPARGQVLDFPHRVRPPLAAVPGREAPTHDRGDDCA
jgi:hypothetical protein